MRNEIKSWHFKTPYINILFIYRYKVPFLKITFLRAVNLTLYPYKIYYENSFDYPIWV